MKGSFESKDGTKRKAISLEEWNAKVDAFIESENSNVGNTAPLYYIFRQDSRSLSRAGGAGFYNETVTADSIGRFARAIGDTNPLWSDPDYAAWVAGFIKEDRSVANSVNESEDKGTYCVHNFGATPEEYSGHSFSKIFGGTAAGARTMYIAESGSNGIVTRAPRADRQPQKNYSLWNTMRRSGLKRQQELLEANTQFRTQQKKQISETA